MLVFNYEQDVDQQRVHELTKDVEYWNFNHDTGTGKSKQVIDGFSHLFYESKIERMVYFAKAGEYANFYYEELPKHFPKQFTLQAVLYDSYKSRLSKFKRDFAKLCERDDDVMKVLVMNIESVGSVQGNAILDKFFEGKPQVYCYVDEATCIKNHKSKRAKALYGYRSKMKYRRIGSGTSITEGLLDMWGQALFLKPGLFGHTSFSSFRAYYCTMEKVFLGQVIIDKVTGYKNKDEFRDYLMKFTSQVTYKSHVHQDWKKVIVPLTSEQQEMYDELKNTALLTYGDQIIEVTNAMALASKAHQIVCGQLKLPDGTYVSIPNNRIKALIDVLEGLNRKAIIWVNYTGALEDIVKALKEHFGAKRVTSYYGATTQDERRKVVQDMQDPNSGVDWMVANQQAAGYGLTITMAKYNVYFSNSFRLELRLQSEARSYRKGQDEDVLYIDLMTPDTLDYRVVDSLRNKKSVSDEILNRPVKDWL